MLRIKLKMLSLDGLVLEVEKGICRLKFKVKFHLETLQII